MPGLIRVSVVCMGVCIVHDMRRHAYGVAADARSDARCFAPRDQPCAPCKAKRRRHARDARRVARQNGRVFARPDAGPFARNIIKQY